jgi:hypothetical protein
MLAADQSAAWVLSHVGLSLLRPQKDDYITHHASRILLLLTTFYSRYEIDETHDLTGDRNLQSGKAPPKQ